MGRAKGEKYYKGYYFRGDLSDSEIQNLDLIYRQQSIEPLKNSLNGITLHDYQTIGVGAMYINKRFFIGDGPGLGKTVETSALLRLLRAKNEMKRFIFATTTDAVYQIKGEIEYYTGLKILPLVGDSKHVERMLRNYNFKDFDGIIIQHSGLSLHNALGKFFSNYLSEFDVFILDESSCVKSKTSKTRERASILSNNMNRVVLLNGTAFETHLMDFYYQFDVLNPMLLPAVSNVKRDYCTIGGGRWATITTPYGRKKKQFQNMFDIVGYKNQELFRDKIKYHYLAREKRHVFKEIPAENYILEMVNMSAVQGNLYSKDNYDFLLNSPSTAGFEFEFSPKTVPKLNKLLSLVQEITGINSQCKDNQGTGEQVVVYCRYREAQYTIQKFLKKLGISSCIINGAVGNTTSSTKELSDREVIRQEFNNKQYDVLITNIQRALNIPTANYMIFYTLETNPSIMYQIMKRIDRNNLTAEKTYFFLCYADSEEVDKLEFVLSDREFQANLFTGTTNNVFEILSHQLEAVRNQDNF